MLDLFHIAKPQGCDIQMFYGSGASTINTSYKTWNKPRGVSNVYFLLIGAGGQGNGSTQGGGSGAVTVWYGSAQNVPDQLRVGVGRSGPTDINYSDSSGSVLLLRANGANGVNGGTATTANQFAASGFFQSIAGQNGSTGSTSPSATTFLSGGGAGGANTVTANYGYTTAGDGYFQLQPIIVGVGGATGAGGIGCGAYISATSLQIGSGFALIASW